MDVYNIADLIIGIVSRYPYTKKLCVQYLYDGMQPPDFVVSVSDAELEEAIRENPGYTPGYQESLCIYRNLCKQALAYDTILLHSSVISVDEEAYVFTAPSGTGKSTHARLWKNFFGDRAVMINDDKPLFRFFEEGIFAYGTPWNGKHRIGTNSRAKVRAICFLSQAVENEIHIMKKREAMPVLLNQIYRPDDAGKMVKLLGLAERLLCGVPIYHLACNISEDAVLTAYQAMKSQN